MQEHMFFVFAAMVSLCAGHGQMSKPTIRPPRAGGGRAPYTPLAFIRPDGFHPKPGVELTVGTDNFGFMEDDYACRGGVRAAVPNGNVLTAGQVYEFEATLYAPHPGDLGIFLSYDSDEQTPKDVDKVWHLIKTVERPLCCDCAQKQQSFPCHQCVQDYWNAAGKDRCSYNPGPSDGTNGWDPYCGAGCHQVRKLQILIPDWVPAGENVILRFEYYAVHLRDDNPGHPSGGNQIEMYANCADVNIIGSANSVQVSQLRGGLKVDHASHLPGKNTDFPQQYIRLSQGYEAFPMVLPAVATFDTSGETENPPVTDSPTTPPDDNGPSGNGPTDESGNGPTDENENPLVTDEPMYDPPAADTAAPTTPGTICEQDFASTGCTIDGGNCDDYYFKIETPPLTVCQCSPTLNDFKGVYCPTKLVDDPVLDDSATTLSSSAAIVASYAALFVLTRFLQ